MNAALLTLNGATARMNKTEARFWVEWLMPRVLDGGYDYPGFEDLKLRLGDDCFYTPDFTVTARDSPGFIVYEVKGFWRDDARVKIKAAAARYQGRIAFYAATWESKGKQWKIETIAAA